MKPREALSDGRVDLSISRILKRWVQDVPPPPDGKLRLFETVAKNKFTQSLSYRSVAVALQELLVEIFSPSIAPTAQPMIYSGDVSRADRSHYYANYADLSVQLLDELSLAMGANYFSVVA